MPSGKSADSLNLPNAPKVGAKLQEGTVLTRTVEANEAEKNANIPSMSLLDLVLNSLHDNKADDVVTIDLNGKSTLADHMIVASGRSTRQVAAIADNLHKRIKEVTGKTASLEGKENSDWVLIDASDVIVHIFRPEVREFYQLEKMWLTETSETSQA